MRQRQAKGVATVDDESNDEGRRVSEFDETPAQPLAPAALPLMSSVVVGWLDAGSAPGRLLVDFPGNARGPRLARTTIVLTDTALMQAVAARQGALLVFENADPALPILIGLLQTPEASLLGALLEPSRAPVDPAAGVGGPVPREAPAPPVAAVRTAQSARLDGESVALEGRADVHVTPFDFSRGHHDSSSPFTSASIVSFSGVGTPSSRPKRTMPPFR